MKKRALRVLLALVMAAGMLSGCGGGTQNQGGETGGETDGEAKGVTFSAAAQGMGGLVTVTTFTKRCAPSSNDTEYNINDSPFPHLSRRENGDGTGGRIMRADLASIARTVTPIAEKYGVERVSLFGSRARGDAGAESDYDFLIADGEIKSLFTFAAFLTDLEDAFHSPVDLISDSSSDQEFVRDIQKEAVSLYERQG